MDALTQNRTQNWRAFVPALALSLFGIGALGVFKVLPVAAASQPVTVYAWDRDALGAVLDAGGRMIGPGGLPGSIIAIADNPEFATELYAHGASLVLRADTTIGCLAARGKS